MISDCLVLGHKHLKTNRGRHIEIHSAQHQNGHSLCGPTQVPGGACCTLQVFTIVFFRLLDFSFWYTFVPEPFLVCVLLFCVLDLIHNRTTVLYKYSLFPSRVLPTGCYLRCCSPQPRDIDISSCKASVRSSDELFHVMIQHSLKKAFEAFVACNRFFYCPISST